MLLVIASAICGFALFAAPALAKEWESNSGKYPSRFKLASKGPQILTIEGGIGIECVNATGEGQIKEANRTLQGNTLNPGECKASIVGVKHKIKTEIKECEGRLILNKGETGEKQQGMVESIKVGGGTCTVTTKVEGTTCELKGGEEGPLSGFRAEQVKNTKGEREVQVKSEVVGIKLKASTGCGIAAEPKATSKNLGRIEGVKIR